MRRSSKKLGKKEGPRGKDPHRYDRISSCRSQVSEVRGERSAVWYEVRCVASIQQAVSVSSELSEDRNSQKRSVKRWRFATCQNLSLKTHFWLLLDLWFLTGIDTKIRIVIHRNWIFNKTMITFEMWLNSFALFACFNSSFEPNCQRRPAILSCE